MTDGVVLAHDYATQHGGAERVALIIAKAFPGSPMHTTLYEPTATHPGFEDVDLRTGPLDHYRLLRHHHRLALPFLAHAVDAQPVAGDVLLASSSGWAHGYGGPRRTVVYCYAPARWLYQPDRYLGGTGTARRGFRSRAGAVVLSVLGRRLRRWDARAAARADRYLVVSTEVQRAVRAAYGIEAEVVSPPPACAPDGPQQAVPGVEPGFLLCVARLLPYKNVDVVIEAAGRLGRRLVVVGDGPDRARLEALAARVAPGLVTLTGRVEDATVRWAYANAAMLLAASYEDFGLTPLEAGRFGVPTVALRAGGFLDSVVDGVTGVFFDAPEPDPVVRAIKEAEQVTWDAVAIADHAAEFSEERFIARLQEIVAEESRLAHAPEAAR